MTATVNYWFDRRCAKAFWHQCELPPYQELLRDTAAWLQPGPGQRWLDLGCGGGQLTRALWLSSGGQLAEIVGVDAAAANAQAFTHLQDTLQPAPGERLRFVAADFSDGFCAWPSAQFDGVVSGLALQYAQAYNQATQTWTEAAYDRLLGEICRLLKPGGRFVFSVNVPEPAWSKVAWHSLPGLFRQRRLLRFLKKAWRMWVYGWWLKREARRGRFHYLPITTVAAKLERAGFANISHRLTYAGQAYLIRCHKPA